MNESNLAFICTCPCCGELVKFKLIKTDMGTYYVDLFHMPEVPLEDPSKYGLEFGSIPNGKDGE